MSSKVRPYEYLDSLTYIFFLFGLGRLFVGITPHPRFETQSTGHWAAGSLIIAVLD